MPSPPSTPAGEGEADRLLFERRRREDGGPHPLPDRRAFVRGRRVDVEREDLVAQDPAVGAVGKLDAEPVVVRGAPDGGEHLVHLGGVDDPETEPRSGVDLRLLGDHPHQRRVVGARRRGGQRRKAPPRRRPPLRARSWRADPGHEHGDHASPAGSSGRSAFRRRGSDWSSGKINSSLSGTSEQFIRLRGLRVVGGPIRGQRIGKRRRQGRRPRPRRQSASIGGFRAVTAAVVAVLAAVVHRRGTSARSVLTKYCWPGSQG